MTQVTPPLTLAQVRTGIRCKIKSTYAGKVVEIGGEGSQLYQDGRPATLWYDYAYANSNDKQQWYIQYVSGNRAVPGKGTPVVTNPSHNKPLANSAIAGEKVLSLYPNPAHEILSVVMPGVNKVVCAKVTDLRGASVLTSYPNDGQVNVANLPPGFYFITVSDGEHEYRQKFAKN